MTVREYTSADASAPTLNGTNGSLATVLDAVLVNGYGSKTAAGWTIAYTATNKRMYTMASGGTGCTLYLDDSSSVTTAKESRICGFLTATGMGTGTGQFPTGSQSSIGIGMLVARKSNTADSTARAWRIVADGHTIIMFIESGDYAAPTAAQAFYFGDFFSLSTTDTSNCIIIARTIENQLIPMATNTATIYEPLPQLSLPNITHFSNVLAGHYCCAAHTNVGGSLNVGKHTDQALVGYNNGGSGMQIGHLGHWTAANNSTFWFNAMNMPNGPDQGLHLSPIWIHHQGNRRGYLKGLWGPMQHLPMGHNDPFSGTGNLAGKSFKAQMLVGTNSNTNGTYGPYAQCFVETSDTWA